MTGNSGEVFGTAKLSGVETSSSSASSREPDTVYRKDVRVVWIPDSQLEGGIVIVERDSSFDCIVALMLQIVVEK